MYKNDSVEKIHVAKFHAFVSGFFEGFRYPVEYFNKGTTKYKIPPHFDPSQVYMGEKKGLSIELAEFVLNKMFVHGNDNVYVASYVGEVKEFNTKEDREFYETKKQRYCKILDDFRIRFLRMDFAPEPNYLVVATHSGPKILNYIGHMWDLDGNDMYYFLHTLIKASEDSLLVKAKGAV